MRALQIEKDAQEIRKRVEQLGKHITNYEEYMRKLGTHIGNSVSMYNTSYRELGKIDKDVMRITKREETGVEPIAIDKPSVD